MLLSYEDVAGYLLTNEWISNKSIVEGGFSIVNVSRRNSNFKVAHESDFNYFLKQEIRDTAPDTKEFGTVAYEAAVYVLLDSLFRGKEIFKNFPLCYAFDRAANLLILQSIPDYINLNEFYLGRGHFPTLLAVKLAEIVSSLHKTRESDKPLITELLGVQQNLPWTFSLSEPDKWYYLNSSVSNLDYIKAIQKSKELCAQISDLKKEWNPCCLIHGDLKWDNCLVPINHTSRENEVKIVDWEFARIGDPCWDVGMIFGEYLYCWFSSIPISFRNPPDQFLAHARFPLIKMQSSIRVFWKTYMQGMGIASIESPKWLRKALAYAAMRLIQSAFEQLQVQPDQNYSAIYLLQLSSNILSRPLEAGVHLLGLPLPNSSNEEQQLSY